MRIRKTGICRGDGKIFIRYRIVLDSADGTLNVVDQSRKGFTLPCNVYEAASDADGPAGATYIVVIPNIPIDQCLSFSVVADDGTVIAKAEKTIRFEIAKWESRFNYRFARDMTRSIRNFDDAGKGDRITLEFADVIPAGQNMKVRLRVLIPSGGFDDLEIKCFTGRPSPVDVSPICLGAESPASDLFYEDNVQELLVSIDLPRVKEYFVIEAIDRIDPKHNGFIVLEPKAAERYMVEWGLRYQHAEIDPAYSEWFEEQRCKHAEAQRQSKITLDLEPCFSIIVPLYRTPLAFLDEMIRSVLGQSYGSLQLVLVNASPEDEQLSERVGKHAQADPRVTVVVLEENLGITLNTWEGIAAATGDYICFLDHDDVLEPNVLFEYALAINRDPGVELLYCDEDKLLANGDYAHPSFKPDFSIDLLRSVNYICHFLCIKASLVRKVEPTPKELEGAQDYDLTLKAIENTEHICHIPKILYHWRIHDESTAADVGSKPYVVDAGIRAVSDHLTRLGIEGEVLPGITPTTHDVFYRVDGEPLVSIVIPTKDEVATLSKCVDSILERSTYGDYEIVLIENNSTLPETFAYYDSIVKADPRVRVEYWPAEFNFSKLMNFGVEKANGDYLILLNNDTEVITRDWIERMLGICQREDVGIVGARLWYPDDTLQHGGVTLLAQGGGVHLGWGLPRDNIGYCGLTTKTQDLIAVTAACMMTKRDIYEQVGGFDERYAVAYNDVDYCLKVGDAGKLIVYSPFVELYHYESLSRGYEITDEKKIRFLKEETLLRSTWAKNYVQGDPYFNRNLDERLPGFYRLP